MFRNNFEISGVCKIQFLLTQVVHGEGATALSHVPFTLRPGLLEHLLCRALLGSWQQKRENGGITQWFSKLLLKWQRSLLLGFHWSNPVIWPSLSSVKWDYVILPQGQTGQYNLSLLHETENPKYQRQIGKLFLSLVK